MRGSFASNRQDLKPFQGFLLNHFKLLQDEQKNYMTTTILLKTGLVGRPKSVFPHRRDLLPANIKTADANGYTKVLVAQSGVYFEKDDSGQWWRKHQINNFEPIKININNPAD